MKTLTAIIVAATLSIIVTARVDKHLHHHVQQNAGSKIEKRFPDMATVYVVSPTKTVYQLDGKILDADKAEAGLKDGEFVIIGTTNPTFTSPSLTKHTATGIENVDAEFLEKSKPPVQLATTPRPPQPGPSISGGRIGLNAKFPSGQFKCSHFPSEYGAVPIDYLGLGGYSGIQYLPGFSLKTSSSVDTIITGISGQKCGDSPGVCSYACPPGYQKTQWTDAQGATGQSIGGLYCNENGYLELTRPSHPTLCELGAGGVTVRNDLNEVVATCRTDYPGTESMVIPTELHPGQSLPLTNPDSATYYKWQKQPTTAQYYVNNKGVAAKDSCLWNCPHNQLSCGNYAPMNIGVGKSISGTTFLSIFPNSPTSSATLDFNIEITGDINSKCAYVNGKFIGGANGCTTGIKPGGTATIRYY